MLQFLVLLSSRSYSMTALEGTQYMSKIGYLETFDV